MPNLTLNAVKALIDEQTKTLKEEITNLRTELASATLLTDNNNALKKEIVSLRAEVADLRVSLNDAQKRTTPPNQSADPESNKTWADAVTASVKTALRDQSVKNEIVVYVPENEHDMEDINALCQKATVAVKPSAIMRIGRPKVGRSRPLKASFPTPFDARAFMTKIDAYKAEAEADDAIRKIRCRPCRTSEEQKHYTACAKQVSAMNEAAKAAGVESFSIRQNGEVWKFRKEGDSWKRVADWKFTPSLDTIPKATQASGNK